ncbi:MAG TPA: glycosyltransferase [Opitutus sp.]|nr:glycosyltransferase [Opitutus sp.]
MQVSFIIPLFNQLPLTQACLSSLQATLPRGLTYEVIFVDDGSTDGTREWLATLGEPVRVVLNERNLGYAGANNRGAAVARGEILGLLNSDLVFERPWLEPMLEVLRALGPRAGVVGNVQLNARTRAVDHTGLRTDNQGRPEHDTSFSSGIARWLRPIRRVAMLTGACVLIRRALWQQLGGFDEAFRNGGEDVDLCFRARAAGQANAVALRSVVLHHVSASPGRKIHDEQNSHRLAQKWRDQLEHLAHRRWCRDYVRRNWSKADTASPELFRDALLYTWRLRSTAPPAAAAAVHELMSNALARWERLARGERDPAPPPAPVIAAADSNSRSLRHPSGFTGLFFDDFSADTAWLRETAEIYVPASDISTLVLRGEFKPHPAANGIETSPLSLECCVEGLPVARLDAPKPGPFELILPISGAAAVRGPHLTLTLRGAEFTNTLAWLGRVTGLWFWQRFRAQNMNRQVRIASLATPEGEKVFDFSRPASPRSLQFAQSRARVEFNIAGYLTADLGVGESARCMIRAADAAGIKTAVVPFKFTCRNTSSDMTYAARFQPDNPYHVNVIHTDPPGTPEVDHYHGAGFRAGKYNIAYWAWELPEFPDMWRHFFAYFDEIWSPSHFSTSAIAMKTRLPVITMPHAISFARPTGSHRARFGLPEDKFLFLFLYDLNSYAARKNPQAAIDAFRRAAHASAAFANETALVIKVHSASDNPDDFAELEASVRDLPGTILIEGTLSRREIYELESACDCFVSLHRSEGFGLAVAECMYLGKPVISTDWSATAEFVNSRNGCPVHFSLTTLQENHGPYQKGQTWADPDIEHAAGWMRRLHADPALAARLGAAARAHIEANFSPAAIGARYRQRLGAIAAF